MLVLSRRVDESITLKVGEVTIKIKPLAFKGSQIEIGIEAPPDVKVLRTELLEPKADFVPYEYQLEKTVRAKDLPIFATSEAVATFLTSRHDLRMRRLEWIEDSSPEALKLWQEQLTARRSG